MKSSLRLFFVGILLALQGGIFFPVLPLYAQDAGGIYLQSLQHTQENERAVHRCCRCIKTNAEPFCVKLTGATACNAYRESSIFQSLPRANQNTLTDFACNPQGNPLDDSGCATPTTPATPVTSNGPTDSAHPAPPAPASPPAPGGAADTSCSQTFADFTAAAASIRPVVTEVASSTPPFESITPTLGVQIPGLTFSPARKGGQYTSHLSLNISPPLSATPWDLRLPPPSS